MPSVTLKNPQLPVPPTPSDRKVHRLSLGRTPLWQPPQGPKNGAGEALPGPSRPLLRLVKVTQKRGFARWFAGGLPVVSRRFPGGFPAALPPPPGPPPQKGPGGHHVKERWWFRRTGGNRHPGPGRCLKSTHSAPRQHPTALHGRKFRRCIPTLFTPRLCPLDVRGIVRTGKSLSMRPFTMGESIPSWG